MTKEKIDKLRDLAEKYDLVTNGMKEIIAANYCPEVTEEISVFRKMLISHREMIVNDIVWVTKEEISK